MVLAERNSEIMRNGRRSRGPSPNGHGGSPDSSSDDDNSLRRNGTKSKSKQNEYEEKIRVGRDFQAVCPDIVPMPERKLDQLNDRALLVWSPTTDIPDSKLEEYISVAKEKYGYNGEQALGMLFWHKHDLGRAVMDLANFTPFPDEWSVEDKVLFEQAFQFHGKSFHRIRQMLPDKSIASLVKYYYSWKKTRHRQSVMDRQEKKNGSENGSDNGSNDESDNEEKDLLAFIPQDIKTIGESSKNKTSIQSSASSKKPQAGHQHINASPGTAIISGPSSMGAAANAAGIGASTSVAANTASLLSSSSATSSGCCTGCGVPCNSLNTTSHGKLCSSCYHHWRRTGTKRPTTGPYFGKRYRDRNADRHKRKPPRGMHINHDDIIALASASNNQDELLANPEREIISLLSQVQTNKQGVSSLKRKLSDSSDNDARPYEVNGRINSRWTNEELLLAVQGVRKFGKDFQAIAETIGTKAEAHVRTFFVNYRRRYNLDNVLKEHESEKESQQVLNEDATENDLVPLNPNGEQQSERYIMEIDSESDMSSEPSPAKKPKLNLNIELDKVEN